MLTRTAEEFLDEKGSGCRRPNEDFCDIYKCLPIATDTSWITYTAVIIQVLKKLCILISEGVLRSQSQDRSNSELASSTHLWTLVFLCRPVLNLRRSSVRDSGNFRRQTIKFSTAPFRRTCVQ